MAKKIKTGGVTFEIDKKKNFVKVKVGKHVAQVSVIDFWGIAFEISTDNEMRDKLMPIRKDEIMKFKKVHTVQVNNDMKAGDTLQFTCNIDVPTRVIEGMRNIIEKEVEGGKELLAEVLPKQLSTTTDDLSNVNKDL
jgi:hypothetical protein